MNLRPWNFTKATLFLALFAATSFVPVTSQAAPYIWGKRTVSGNAVQMTLTSTHTGSRFTDVTFQNYTGDRAVIKIDGANNVIFRRCKFINFKAVTKLVDLIAVEGVKGLNIRFFGCTFDRVAGDCIQMGHGGDINDNRTWVIQDCIFKRPFIGGAEGTQASENAIDIKAVTGITLQNCWISGYRRTSPTILVNNVPTRIKHKGASGSNGEGIVCHLKATSVKIKRCKISNCVSGLVVPRGNGGTDLVNGVQIWNNIISDNLSFGIVLSGGKNVKIYYNTLVNNGVRNLGINTHSIQQYASINNLFAGTGGLSTDFGGSSNKYYTIAAAKFRTAKNYHLRSNSPARDKASNGAAFYGTYDVDGQTRSANPRDLGADEYK